MSTYNRLGYLSDDVQRTGKTFRTITTKFRKNSSVRNYADKSAMVNAEHELYFAARSAWREALKMEAHA